MMENNDDDYDLDDILQGVSNTLTVTMDLLLFPNYVNLFTIHLLRRIYAERKQKKK